MFSLFVIDVSPYNFLASPAADGGASGENRRVPPPRPPPPTLPTPTTGAGAASGAGNATLKKYY